MKSDLDKRQDKTFGTDEKSPDPTIQNPAPGTQLAEPTIQLPDFSTNHLFVYASTELLQQGKSARFQAPGHSMHPSIKNEDIITVVPIASSSVKRGDVILYRTAHSVIAHRVARIKKKKGARLFILRADALGAQKERVETAQVLGKVVFVERNGASVDIYSAKATLFRLGYNFALRLKRWMV